MNSRGLKRSSISDTGQEAVQVPQEKQRLKKPGSRPGCHFVFEILIQLVQHDVFHPFPPPLFSVMPNAFEVGTATFDPGSKVSQAACGLGRQPCILDDTGRPFSRPRWP